MLIQPIKPFNKMNKIIYTLAAIFLFILNAKTQNVPNGGMENWTHITATNYWNPDSFSTSNNSFATVVAKDSLTQHGGTYCAKMTNVSFGPNVIPAAITTGTINLSTLSMQGGLPFTSKPATFEGWYKYTPGNGDTCLFVALLTRDSANIRDTVGISIFQMDSAKAGWTHFTAWFNYIHPNQTPDTALIVFSASRTPLHAHPNSQLWIDDVGLFGTYNNINEIPILPLIKVLNTPWGINFQITNQVTTSLRIFDIAGKEIESIAVSKGDNFYATIKLPNGEYFFQMLNAKNISLGSGKFIVAH